MTPATRAAHSGNTAVLQRATAKKPSVELDVEVVQALIRVWALRSGTDSHTRSCRPDSVAGVVATCPAVVGLTS